MRVGRRFAQEVAADLVSSGFFILSKSFKTNRMRFAKIHINGPD